MSADSLTMVANALNQAGAAYEKQLRDGFTNAKSPFVALFYVTMHRLISFLKKIKQWLTVWIKSCLTLLTLKSFVP